MAAGVVDLIEILANFGVGRLRGKHFTNAIANAFGRPTQVGFQNLAHIHSGRNAQGVQHNVNGRAIGHVRHVFNRNNA